MKTIHEPRVTKAEIVEGILFGAVMIALIVIPFVVGVHVTRYFRWGCG